MGGDDDSLTWCRQILGICLIWISSKKELHQLELLCANGQKAMISSWKGAERVRQSLEGRRLQILREDMLRRIVQGGGAEGTEFACSILLPELYKE